MANKKVSQLTSKPSVLTTDLFPIADPSTGQLFKTTISDLGTAIGSGVSSVNSLVGAVVLDTDDIQELVSPTNKWFTDTRARAALSASSPLTYNSGTGAFGIQVANGSQNGYLSSTDWTTFNAKQAALSGTGFVKISGTTISYDNSTYLTTSAAASTYLALAGGELTGALLGTSAAFSGYVGIGNSSPLYNLDVTGSGRFSGDLRIESTNPRIYLTDTDNNPDYFISNTDGTFTVYDVTNSTARFTIGTTGNATFTNAITGGGSITGQSLYSNGIISAGTSLSVGTFVSAGGSLTGSALYVTGMTAGNGAIYHTGSRLTFANYNASGTLHFEVNGGVGALTIAADGSATFQNYISATKVGVGVGTPATLLEVKSTTTNLARIRVSSTTSTAGNYRGYEFSNGSTFRGGLVQDESTEAISIFTPIGGQSFTIASSGAATFSSSVTATSTSAYSGNALTLQTKNDSSSYYMNVYPTDAGASGITWTFRHANSAAVYDTMTFSQGKVGIGTTSPNTAIDARTVGSTTYSASNLSAYQGAYFSNQGTGGFANITLNTLDAAGASNCTTAISAVSETSGTRNSAMTFATREHSTGNIVERMRITSGGGVLIGTSTLGTATGTEDLLTIGKSGIASFGVNFTNGTSTRWGFIYANSTKMVYGSFNDTTFETGASALQRMKITSVNGNVEITNGLAIGRAEENNVRLTIRGTTSDSSGYSIINRDTNAADLFVIRNDGYGYLKNSSWAYGSDLRMKENISNVENGMEFVSKLKPKHFDYINGTKDNLGFIAQEIQEILPQAVIETQSGTLALKTDFLVPMLVKAVQELKVELDTLKNK